MDSVLVSMVTKLYSERTRLLLTERDIYNCLYPGTKECNFPFLRATASYASKLKHKTSIRMEINFLRIYVSVYCGLEIICEQSSSIFPTA